MAHMDIDCVDSTGNDETVKTFRRALPMALRVHTVGHMVRSIEHQLGLGRANKLRRLRVFAHGSPGEQGLGRSQNVQAVNYLSIRMSGNELSYRDVLASLQGRFASGGWVELHGCSVGQGEPGRRLTLALARLWRVNVLAGTVTQYTSAGFETSYIVAHPNGQVQERSGHQVVTAGSPMVSEEEMLGAGIVALFLAPPVGIGILGALALR